MSPTRSYDPPTIDVVGTIRDLTLAGRGGPRLDADFSAGTTRGDLTFS